MLNNTYQRWVLRPISKRRPYRFQRAMLFEVDEPKPGSGGKVTLWADDKQIGESEMPNTIPLIFMTYAGMDTGRDNRGVVDLAYEDRAPYAFTGTINDVVFDLKPDHHEHQQEHHAAEQQATVMHGIHG